jgi:MtN3 and saliva related transmembrane protein
MDAVTFLGFLAAFCSTVSFLPQVVKAWRTQSTKDISLGMFAVMATGTVLWIAYAVIRLDPPLIAANTMTFCLVGTILVLKLRHG